MTRPSFNMAVCAYDRVAPLLDGRVGVEGCDLSPIILSPEETFHRAFRFQEFEIAELSLSSHAVTVARGNAPYVAIPVFLSRVFRHSGIYIRTDRGIARPEDLKGKLVGVPEYQQTANVWARGILADDHGVQPADIKWRNGGIDEPGRTERTELRLPKNIDLQPIPARRTLSDMLEGGELDAVFSPREPQCFTKGKPHVARLFPEYRAVEEAYYRRTKIFPIMHIIGIRADIAKLHPWLPASLYKAFLRAKDVAMYELGLIGRLTVMLPWSVAELHRTREIMGDDYWSYGLDKNLDQLKTFLRYSFEQGLSDRPVEVEELFASPTLDMSKS